MKNYCGLDCAQCPAVDSCPGCAATGGKPFGGTCVLGECCKAQGCESPASCFSGKCALKEQLIREFNDLHIPHMGRVTDLNALPGSYINLEYTLPGGQKVKFWEDGRVYLGNQLGEAGRQRPVLRLDRRRKLAAGVRIRRQRQRSGACGVQAPGQVKTTGE